MNALTFSTNRTRINHNAFAFATSVARTLTITVNAGTLEAFRMNLTIEVIASSTTAFVFTCFACTIARTLHMSLNNTLTMIRVIRVNLVAHTIIFTLTLWKIRTTITHTHVSINTAWALAVAIRSTVKALLLFATDAAALR